jgi:starch synthase
MPSRVEPCGLNQLYAMRYGTIPIVRSTGGLRDTVTDMGDPEGFGIRFDQASVGDIIYSIGRAIQVYQDKDQIGHMRKRMMQIDHSWENTVQQYDQVYRS